MPKDGIFHTERASFNLAKVFLRGALNRYYGAYMTDILNIYDMKTKKLIYEPDSNRVKEFFDNTVKNSDAIEYAHRKFLDKFNTLKEINNGKTPTIIALGDNTATWAKRWSGGAKVIKIYHPSKIGLTVRAHNAFAKRSLGDPLTPEDLEAIDKVQQKNQNAGIKRSAITAIKEKNINIINDNIKFGILETEKAIEEYNRKLETETAPGLIRAHEEGLAKATRVLPILFKDQAFMMTRADKFESYWNGKKRIPLDMEDVKTFNKIKDRYLKSNTFSDNRNTGGGRRMNIRDFQESLESILKKILK